MKKLTDELKKLAVKVYAETGNQKNAAIAVGVSLRTLQNEMSAVSQFKEDMEEAKLGYNARLIDILRGRIEAGDSKMADVLLMFEMKRHMPEYRERYEHKVDADIKIITGVPRPKEKDAVQG